MSDLIQPIPEVVKFEEPSQATGAPLAESFSGAGICLSKKEVQLRADNSPFAEAALFITTVPEDFRADALSMLKDEQQHRHNMEGQVIKDEQARAMDMQEKNFRLLTLREEKAAASDLLGRIFGLVALLAYFCFLAWAICINNAVAIQSLTGIAIAGLIGSCIGYMVKGKKEQTPEEKPKA